MRYDQISEVNMKRRSFFKGLAAALAAVNGVSLLQADKTVQAGMDELKNHNYTDAIERLNKLNQLIEEFGYDAVRRVSTTEGSHYRWYDTLTDNDWDSFKEALRVWHENHGHGYTFVFEVALRWWEEYVRKKLDGNFHKALNELLGHPTQADIIYSETPYMLDDVEFSWDIMAASGEDPGEFDYYGDHRERAEDLYYSGGKNKVFNSWYRLYEDWVPAEPHDLDYRSKQMIWNSPEDELLTDEDKMRYMDDVERSEINPYLGRFEVDQSQPASTSTAPSSPAQGSKPSFVKKLASNIRMSLVKQVIIALLQNRYKNMSQSIKDKILNDQFEVKVITYPEQQELKNITFFGPEERPGFDVLDPIIHDKERHPIVIDDQNVVLAGHEFLKAMNYTKNPVIAIVVPRDGAKPTPTDTVAEQVMRLQQLSGIQPASNT